jgi:hypothetical protein
LPHGAQHQGSARQTKLQLGLNEWNGELYVTMSDDENSLTDADIVKLFVKLSDGSEFCCPPFGSLTAALWFLVRFEGSYHPPEADRQGYWSWDATTDAAVPSNLCSAADCRCKQQSWWWQKRVEASQS